MRRIWGKICEFLLFSGVAVFWGFIGGLMISMAVFSALHKPFWCLGVTFFFMLFHLDDFKLFYGQKNWMALSGRFIVLFSITSAIVSLFVFALGAFAPADILDLLIFVILMPTAIVAAIFWVLLERYGNHTRLFKELKKIADGLQVLGVLWKH